VGFFQKTYLLEVVKGLTITMRHLLANIFRINKMITVSYPEQKPFVPEIYRSEHRLMLRPDGTARCTACQLCETACPAHCIRIEPGEGTVPGVEKLPVKFDIDLLRCVYCGFCVEACPCDAIRMDTGKYENASFEGPKLVYDLKTLLNNHPEGKDKISKAIY